MRNLTFSFLDLKRIIKRFFNLLRNQKVQGKPLIKDLVFIPIINPCIQKINVHLIKAQIKSLIDKETIIWITSPSPLFPYLLNRLDFKALVYEILDDYSKMHPSREKIIIETEKYLIDKANLIITTSHALSEKIKDPSKKVLLVGNGVDFDFFNKDVSEKKPKELDGLNKIAGYTGFINGDWLDFETINFLADHRKDIDFVFIGPLKIKSLPNNKNFHFLGEKDYQEMPRYCNFFDVCLIPFKKGKFADSINPVKFYEYLALGKPIIAYEMKELLPFNNLIYLAKDKQDFFKKLELAIIEDNPELIAKRKEIAGLNDWEKKAKSITEALLTLDNFSYG